ncbi:hypothetical protein GGH96_001868 [Coemansia sp. RSA 1972]|nr:hypothetical protein GGH96_001868 [Coemansia sp. RSA 1972]
MHSSDEFEESSDYYSIINTSDEESGDDLIIDEDNRDDARIEEDSDNDATIEEDEVIEISSSTHGVEPAQPAPMMRFTVPGQVGPQNVQVSVVSLARYTFADPVAAADGPAPLEPPLQTLQIGHENSSRPVGVQSGQAVTRRGPHSMNYGEFDDDRLIAEFTEERSNRRLARIARRLLLPDSYVEACYDLHEFMATQEPSYLAIESVQRNVFKCLKICARLSKLHGYSIQHMWQVIQQAHKRMHEFTPPRARTIDLWNLKLSNRIRMMAVSPAADGSAPQRLPSVPPPELLNAHARDRLLPLPEMNVSALNDRGFNRSQGMSSASYYLANPVKQSQNNRILPPISELVSGLPNTQNGPNSSDSQDDAQNAEYTVEEPASDIFALTAQSTAVATTSDAAAAADSLASTREAELAIIEHQLRELERTPAHRMGPMMRAALNLLVEMRFRLQLGLPRSAQTAENALTAPLRIPNTQHSQNSEAYGDGLSEDRVIEYVLDQISTTRRNQRQLVPANGNTQTGFGAPLYMMPHQGVFNSSEAPENASHAYRERAESRPVPRSELRRRRDGDDDDNEESEPSAPSEDDFDADGDLEVDEFRGRRARSDSTRRMPEPPRRRMQRRRRRT